MLSLPVYQESLMANRVHRFATLWRITRTDGVVYRFTNHDNTVNYAGLDYTPVGGFDASAVQKQEGLKDRNLSVKGVIHTLAITFDDLRTGKFRRALVEEMIIDWRYPWADPFSTSRFWITSTTFTGEMWTAEMEGLTHKLKQTVGRTYGRTCDVREVGDSRCTVNMAGFTFTGAVTGINTARRDFNTDVSQTTDYFKYGKITWTSGANDGQTMEVYKSFGTGGRILLWLPMGDTVAIGDTFSVKAGCDHTAKSCRDKFSNIVNFRGFNTMPGTDAMMRTPNAKA